MIRLALLLALVAAPALAAPRPVAFTHTGYVLDSADNPVTQADLAVTFRLFDQSAPVQSETLLWHADCAVDVVKGYFGVTLGAGPCAGTPALDSSVLLPGAGRWLEIAIGGITLSPRLAITATPTATTALGALDSDKLGGLAPSAYWQKSDDLANATFGTGTLATHGHAAADVSGLGAAAVAAVTSSGLPWSSVTGVTTSTTWPGTVDAARLTNAAFAASSHTHPGTDVTSAVANATHADTASALAPGTYSAAVSFTSASNAFTGSGAGLTSLPAGQLTGTVPGAAVGGTYGNAVTFSNAANVFTGTFVASTAGASITCSGTTEGTIRYNYTAHQLEFCNGTTWMASTATVATKTIVSDGGSGRRWSDGTYATSCNGYFSPPPNYAYSGLTGDGLYTISIAGTPTVVMCNMTEQSGGWTLLTSYGSSCGGYFTSGNWTNTNTTPSATPKAGPCTLYSQWSRFANIAASTTLPTFLLQQFGSDSTWYTIVNTQSNPNNFTNTCPTTNTVAVNTSVVTAPYTFCGYYLAPGSGGAFITGDASIPSWFFNPATSSGWTSPGGQTGIPINNGTAANSVSLKNLWYVR